MHSVLSDVLTIETDMESKKRCFHFSHSCWKIKMIKRWRSFCASSQPDGKLLLISTTYRQ